MATAKGQSAASRAPGFASILRGFLESAMRFPERPAIVVDGQPTTYRSLLARARQVAAAVDALEPENASLGAVLATRSMTAYAAILGILGSGRGYVPLNPKFPVERSAKMLFRSGARALVVDATGFQQLPGLLKLIDFPLAIILPDGESPSGLATQFPRHRFVFSNELPDGASYSLKAEAKGSAIAYLLFTSGSTGEPKGVPISQQNVRAYIEATCDHYDVNEHDRISQEFDLTFDLSVHDMFVCWERGACLCCVPENAVMMPAKFIRESRLTMWFSVPSVAGLLAKMRLLTPASFPTLRWSLFCGEPFAASYARLWQEAAPNSVVENLYGPTETTIAITRYRWDNNTSPDRCVNGIVPIGWPFDGQRIQVVTSDRLPVSAGGTGELCLAGSQVTTGYWNDTQRSAEQFINLPGSGDTIWYRTGDLVEEDPDGCLRYLGRVDHQVKIRGYRVELQEIEGVLREACCTEQVAAVPWPVANGNAGGIVAFVAGVEHLDVASVLGRCRVSLPDYMIPRKVFHLNEMPLNANGKMDRKELTMRLQNEPV
jgi:amino acid adenylation domain-containing protein